MKSPSGRAGASNVSGSDDVGGSELATAAAASTSWDRSDVAQPVLLAVDDDHGLAIDDAHVAEQPLGIGRRGRGHLVAARHGPLILSGWGDELDLDVVAVAAVDDVGAAATEEHVVAGAAHEHVVAVAADEDVVALAAVGGELDRPCRQAGGLDDVVAGEGVDREPVVGGLGAGHVDLGGQPENRRAGGVAGNQDDVVTVGGIDDDGVGLSVAPATCRRGWRRPDSRRCRSGR